MRFVTVRDLRTTPGKVWEKLSEERELVVTRNGKPIAIMAPTTEETFEMQLKAVRRARGMMAVKALQAASVKAGTDKMTMAEINAIIDDLVERGGA